METSRSLDEGARKPLLVLLAQHGDRLLLAVDRRHDAHEPKDEQPDGDRRPQNDHDEVQHGHKGDDQTGKPRDHGRDEQAETLAEMEGAKGGLLIAVHDDRDDETDDRNVSKDGDGAILSGAGSRRDGSDWIRHRDDSLSAASVEVTSPRWTAWTEAR